MPRTARAKSSTGIYHVMLRGINRQNIFEEIEDRRRFVETLEYFKKMGGYNLYGYCLMDNHVHILIREIEEPLSIIIKRISSRYVFWYNKKYSRCGHLFQERYKSEAVETDAYLLTVLRYIHQNPLKAGITKSIRDYYWSSYKEYIDMPTVVDTDFALGIFSLDRSKAIELLKNHTIETGHEQCLDYRENFSKSDEEVISYINQSGISSVSELQRLEKARRNDVIREMKKIKGITIRQLARITGLSKSVIDRA